MTAKPFCCRRRRITKHISTFPTNCACFSQPLPGGEFEESGVIVYTRTADGNDVLAWVDMKGCLITQSQFAILRAAHCSADTPAQPPLEAHHELVQKGLEYSQEIARHLGGQLGKKTGARYRAFTRLSAFYDRYKDSLFVNEPLRLALDEMYKYPLKSYAQEALNRQLKAGIHDEDLANLVVSLREDDKLCLIGEDEVIDKDPQIICSMGLRQQP